MKKLLKSLSLSLVMVITLSCVGVPAFAQSSSEITLSERNEMVISALKTNARSSRTQEQKLQAALGGKEIAFTEEQVAQIQSPVAKLNSVKIDDSTTVTFFTDSTFTVTTVSKDPVQTRATSPTYSTTVTRYGPGKILKLYTIKVSGTFSGTVGKVPTAKLSNASYTRGTLSMWEVSDWEKGTEKDAYQASCYGRGNFYYGFETNGLGMTIQEVYEEVHLCMDASWEPWGETY